MNKRRKTLMVNLDACLRAVAVAVGAYLLSYLLIGMARQVLLTLYGWSLLATWRGMAEILSTYRLPLMLLGTTAALALFARWILRPVFDDFAGMVTSALRLDDKPEEEPPAPFPKGLEQIEDELRSLRQELRLWKYAVQQAEQRKDDLVVSLAHDIRTPLTSVLGYLELLDEGPDLTPQQRVRFVAVALRKARRMQTLVDELFEITRFNVGQIELERVPVGVRILLQQLTEELMPLAKSRKTRVEVDCRELDQIFVDPDKMARALDNILHNAVSYCEPGGVIRAVADRDPQGRVRIRISNTGADIPPEKLARFFEKFYRGDESRSSASGRSGLGLAIAKSIIEAHGGSISAENQGRVTTFTVLLDERNDL